MTTPEAWVPALGAAQHGFPYLSGAGRLVLKDTVILAGGWLLVVEPLVRLSHCEVSDHVNYRKNYLWPSYRCYSAFQRLNRQCATFARFSEPGDLRVFQHNRHETDLPSQAVEVKRTPTVGASKVCN